MGHVLQAGGTLGAQDDAVSLGVDGMGGAAIQIRGTWTGTITFEGAVEGTFTALNVKAAAGTTAVTTTTVNGLWFAPIAGLSMLQARMSTFGSGKAILSIKATESPFFFNTPTPAVTPGGSSGDLQYNNAGAFGGYTPGAGVVSWLQTPTSANLAAAVTDESGTGALLFANGDIGAATGTSLTLTGSSGTPFVVNTQTLVADATNGYVGVNCVPTRSFQIVASAANIGPSYDIYLSSTVGAGWNGRKARGTSAAPRRAKSGDVISGLSAVGAEAVDDSTDATFPPAAMGQFRFFATEDITSTTRGCKFSLQTCTSGTNALTTRMTIDDTGMTFFGRVNVRLTTAANATSITPNSDLEDVTYQLNTQVAGPLTINADAGTPAEMQALTLKIKSTNQQTFAWNAQYTGGSPALPIKTTGGGTTDYYFWLYNSLTSKWSYRSTFNAI